ncbi:hypothetical protein OMP40_31830 [Cohnella rhizosphaerae]|uniref:Uncharacterized protein n=1 Tax=Cohnella rhizosphaerae TaxID=1457232 RepID=A0A9X4KYW1_9BACL|nr:hypothetical protein [Cohnella rhizosphaerae]MDG0813365.1 hypothetical protein [Cohnella rhizosphaerae]
MPSAIAVAIAVWPAEFVSMFRSPGLLIKPVSTMTLGGPAFFEHVKLIARERRDVRALLLVKPFLDERGKQRASRVEAVEYDRSANRFSLGPVDVNADEHAGADVAGQSFALRQVALMAGGAEPTVVVAQRIVAGSVKHGMHAAAPQDEI